VSHDRFKRSTEEDVS